MRLLIDTGAWAIVGVVSVLLGMVAAGATKYRCPRCDALTMVCIAFVAVCIAFFFGSLLAFVIVSIDPAYL
ncbi:hypothetical protein KTT_40870 [Tengunoibacter tsumagoiensis]|uniref:Uncharacterized protein n=2 Tax=Tengunoibacter tsumagoiensis TaxID=2014871 RepID=A0A402A504_9CHLR|nr:hypothetical protein KTT_40330 [Tengunoibacter tsumagoiensis]GCE14228.1 hypothetical protein KTT_40870 [Tengunoibacter tsumagoiensis]